MRYDDNIDNIKNFINISIELNDKLYVKIMKKYYDSREKLNIYVKISNFYNNNNKNQRNNIDYEITLMKLNVRIRRKKNFFLNNIIKNKNCIMSITNQVVSYENIRRIIIYNVLNSMFY